MAKRPATAINSVLVLERIEECFYLSRLDGGPGDCVARQLSATEWQVKYRRKQKWSQPYPSLLAALASLTDSRLHRDLQNVCDLIALAEAS